MFIVVLIAAAAICTGVVLVFLDEREKRDQAQRLANNALRDLSVVRAELMAEQARFQMAEATINELRAELKDCRQTAKQREDDLLRQSQSMAERVATLRMKGLSEGGDAQFIPSKPDKPYSEDLIRFMEGLVTEEARNMVEEKIEEYRALGLEDEQIYQKIREGEAA